MAKPIQTKKETWLTRMFDEYEERDKHDVMFGLEARVAFFADIVIKMNECLQELIPLINVEDLTAKTWDLLPENLQELLRDWDR